MRRHCCAVQLRIAASTREAGTEAFVVRLSLVAFSEVGIPDKTDRGRDPRQERRAHFAKTLEFGVPVYDHPWIHYVHSIKRCFAVAMLSTSKKHPSTAVPHRTLCVRLLPVIPRCILRTTMSRWGFDNASSQFLTRDFRFWIGLCFMLTVFFDSVG